ncbi:MAG: transglutaminase-like domain-containing protein [Phycisphaerales bacterium JB063]
MRTLMTAIVATACLITAPALAQANPPRPTGQPAADTAARDFASRLSRDDRRAVNRPLERAGENVDQLRNALRDAPDAHLPAVVFLIANMPDRDLQAVTAEYLLNNVTLAYEAWHNAPWHDQVTEQQFLQYILPFATLNERRDDWRQDFYDQLREQCWKFDNILDATNWLNDHLNDHFNVYFHATRRPKPDQSPYESIEAGYASCTGLSILMTDACRAVGIPARIVGVPLWTEIQGNHNWVEVFDDRWYNVGGTNSDARDDDWVNDRCRNMTDPDHWHHSVYASCTRQTATHFPLVWDLEITYVPALNVTRFYSEPVDVDIPLRDAEESPIESNDPSGEGKIDVRVYWAGELVARKDAAPEDTSVTVRLAGSSTYRIVLIGPGGLRHESTLTTD